MTRTVQMARLITPVLEWAARHKDRVGTGAMESSDFELPLEFTGRDYLAFLLRVDAEIEHGLMIQYLYSAYSLGGPQVPEKHQKMVQSWRDIILGIAKEEMGHFVTVQNVLKLIGAPLNFGRENYPWDTPFYPFPFTLGPLTLESLARYVYAEAPLDWLRGEDPLAKEIVSKVDATVSDPHTVGALFDVILKLVNDPKYISEDVFQPATLPFQANFDEWGRGYKDGQRGSAHDGEFKKNPNVLVMPVLSRFDAYTALQQIAEQGEGEKVNEVENPSHFARFLKIYKEYKQILIDEKDKFQPGWNVGINPYVLPVSDPTNNKTEPTPDPKSDLITNTDARLWAQLFNIRYRMLLNFLNHSFLLNEGHPDASDHAPRGLIVHSSFGEMYNLRAIAGILVQLPLTDLANGKMAGPPFQIPYTLELPFGEQNRWNVHSSLIMESANLIAKLEQGKGQQHGSYLGTLHAIDAKLLQTIKSFHL